MPTHKIEDITRSIFGTTDNSHIIKVNKGVTGYFRGTLQEFLKFKEKHPTITNADIDYKINHTNTRFSFREDKPYTILDFKIELTEFLNSKT